MSARSCPACGSADTARIVYGLVPEDGLGPDDMPGGCVVGGVDPPPDRRCRSCDHTWRFVPVALDWPDPRAHPDGESVQVAGTVGRVVLKATTRDDVWADFGLAVEEGVPPLRCLASPTAFSSLRIALEPGLRVRVSGQITRNPDGVPELHVSEWVTARG